MQKWVELRKLISPNWRSLLPGQFIRNCQIDLVCLFCAVGNRVANCTNVAIYHPFVKRHCVGQSEEAKNVLLKKIKILSGHLNSIVKLNSKPGYLVTFSASPNPRPLKLGKESVQVRRFHLCIFIQFPKGNIAMKVENYFPSFPMLAMSSIYSFLKRASP